MLRRMCHTCRCATRPARWCGGRRPASSGSRPATVARGAGTEEPEGTSLGRGRGGRGNRALGGCGTAARTSARSPCTYWTMEGLVGGVRARWGRYRMLRLYWM